MDNRKYIIDTGIQALFKDLNISVQDVLRHAHLPLDLLSRKSPSLNAEEYFRLWDGVSYIMRDEPTFPLHIAQTLKPESFNPAIFACFCSPNLNTAANRISYYKPLVGPMRLDVTQNSERTTIAFKSVIDAMPLSATMVAFELAFWVQITRLATREEIVPAAIYTTVDIPAKEAYETYFGTHIHRADFNGVAFHAHDAARPFLTASDEMWETFEPRLNKRMQDLEKDASFRDRVRACLMETLASGQYSKDDVAARLAVSGRTLQRRLREEDTNFQEVLDSLREELARHYLARSDYSSGQIAFLLGYEDPNSFFRAFRSWTGQTPEQVRAYQ